MLRALRDENNHLRARARLMRYRDDFPVFDESEMHDCSVTSTVKPDHMTSNADREAGEQSVFRAGNRSTNQRLTTFNYCTQRILLEITFLRECNCFIKNALVTHEYERTRDAAVALLLLSQQVVSQNRETISINHDQSVQVVAVQSAEVVTATEDKEVLQLQPPHWLMLL